MTDTPRLAHNAALCAEFVQRHKVAARYPKLSEQLPLLPLELEALVTHGYNPSIARQGEGLLMAYRHHAGTLATKLALAEVTFGGRVQSNRALDFGYEPASAEDPKLFTWKDATWICWVESTWPHFPVTSVVKYGRLEGNRLVAQHQIQPPNPTPIEKNHVPLVADGVLHVIYHSEPEQIVFALEDGKVAKEYRAPAPLWPYGAIRGGTVPLPYDGALLRFFHSGVDKEWGAQWPRRYFVGAMLMEAIPPFAPKAVSVKPIAYGSELDDLKVSQRPGHHKQAVVFPGGAVLHNGEVLLSLGVNDSACALARVKPESIEWRKL